MNAQHDMIFSNPTVNRYDTAILCEGFASGRTLYIFSGSATATLEWYRRNYERDLALGEIDTAAAFWKVLCLIPIAGLLILVMLSLGSIDNSEPSRWAPLWVEWTVIPVLVLGLIAPLLLLMRNDERRELVEREDRQDRSPSELLSKRTHPSLLSSSGECVTVEVRARIALLVGAELEAEAYDYLTRTITDHRTRHLSRTLKRASSLHRTL